MILATLAIMMLSELSILMPSMVYVMQPLGLMMLLLQGIVARSMHAWKRKRKRETTVLLEIMMEVKKQTNLKASWQASKAKANNPMPANSSEIHQLTNTTPAR